MINDIMQRLMAAQTDEERSWIATESLLESLPEDVATALWAVAIPHWFNGDILAALCPELADRAEEIYQQLQKLSCVEVFPDRGHNVHELTRNQLLDRLCKDNPEGFRELSGKAATYFAKGNRSETQIEWIYHLVVIYPARGLSELQSLLQRWSNTSHRTELETLANNLQEQVKTNRIAPKITRMLRTALSSSMGMLDSKSETNNKIEDSSNKELRSRSVTNMLDYLVERGRTRNIKQDVDVSGSIAIGAIEGNLTIVQNRELGHRNEPKQPKHIEIKTIERVSQDALNWFLEHSHWALQQAYPMSNYDCWEFESISEVETGLYNAIFLMTFSLQSIPYGTYQWRIKVIINESGDVINVEDIINTCPLRPGQQSVMIGASFKGLEEFLGKILGT